MGFTRQHENTKSAHFRVGALHTPPKFHERIHRGRPVEGGLDEEGVSWKEGLRGFPSLPFGREF